MSDREEVLARLRREGAGIVGGDDRRRPVPSRDALRASLRTKFRTTFIGAISVVEEVFGFLWGGGEPPPFLHEADAEYLRDYAPAMDALREEARTRILDLGNAQLRAADAEVEGHDVTQRRFVYEFRAGPDGNLREGGR